MLNPTAEEAQTRDRVMHTIIADVVADRRVKLPEFDPELSRPSELALLTVGLEPNPYCGTVGPYRYQFEGEEDLLHLIVTRVNEEGLTAEEGQLVAGFVLRGVPSALIWLRPGHLSQHFYVGHDELLLQPLFD